jgi:hypothetical protein
MKTALCNGKIYTVEGEGWDQFPAEAVVYNSDGIIELVGTSDEAKAALTDEDRVIDLEGRMVLPGFIDGHVHVPGDAYAELFELDLTGVPWDGISQAVRAFVNSHADQDIIFGSGFNIGMVDDQGNPICAEWIDAGCCDTPVVIRSIDMHSRLLNTKAMQMLGITEETVSVRGIVHKDASGRPTGVFTDARDIVNIEAEHSHADKIRAIEHFQEKMNQWGYTAMMAIAPNMDLTPDIYFELDDVGDLTLRVNCSEILRPEDPDGSFRRILQLKEQISVCNEKISFTTAKIALDGVIEGETAYLHEPYADNDENNKDYRGEPNWSVEELTEYITKFDKEGLQVHIHSIGDAATSISFRAIQEAQKQNGARENRHVITHLQLVDKDDITGFAKENIIAAIQPFWHCKEPDWFEFVDQKALGMKRAEAEYPGKEFIDAGVVITASGDFPVSPENDPLLGIQIGVTRNLPKDNEYGVEVTDDRFVLGAEQRIPLKNMIEAYTINGAYQLFREDEVGSIKAGKKADLVILDKDLFVIDPMEITTAKVCRTIFNGKTVYLGQEEQ